MPTPTTPTTPTTTTPTTTTPATPATPTPMTGQELAQAQAQAQAPVLIAPVLTYSPDGAASFAVRSVAGPQAGRDALMSVAASAHLSGLSPKQAAREAARLYRAQLADALLECGIRSPALERASGRAAAARDAERDVTRERERAAAAAAAAVVQADRK